MRGRQLHDDFSAFGVGSMEGSTVRSGFVLLAALVISCIFVGTTSATGYHLGIAASPNSSAPFAHKDGVQPNCVVRNSPGSPEGCSQCYNVPTVTAGGYGDYLATSVNYCTDRVNITSASFKTTPTTDNASGITDFHQGYGYVGTPQWYYSADIEWINVFDTTVVYCTSLKITVYANGRAPTIFAGQLEYGC